jgi:hypothetical protein
MPICLQDCSCADFAFQRYLDVSLAHSHTAGLNAEPGAGSTWMERMPMTTMGDMNTMPLGGWEQQDDNGLDNGGMHNLP